MAIRRFAILLLKYGLLAVALAITAGLSALTTMRVVLKAQEVSVPSLVGRRVPDAGNLAARHRLLLRIEGKRNDPRVAADLIVEQDPKPGVAPQDPAQRAGLGEPGAAAAVGAGGGR